MNEPVLEVRNLAMWYTSSGVLGKRRKKQVLHDVSLSLYPGEILGLVGESGSGKTSLAKAIVGIYPYQSGEIHHYTQSPQMIFQDPFSSLNPSKTIGWIIEEPLRISGQYSKKERKQLVADMLSKVGLPPAYEKRRPRELSGGQRQRVGIALSLIQQPQLILADEPLSALDVTIQAQILRLLLELKEELCLSYLFITHDLSIVYQICDRVAVLHEGIIVETGPVEEVFSHPVHAYTKMLLEV